MAELERTTERGWEVREEPFDQRPVVGEVRRALEQDRAEGCPEDLRPIEERRDRLVRVRQAEPVRDALVRFEGEGEPLRCGVAPRCQRLLGRLLPEGV